MWSPLHYNSSASSPSLAARKWHGPAWRQANAAVITLMVRGTRGRALAPYFHVGLHPAGGHADIAYQNKASIYDILFKASAETLITIAVRQSRRARMNSIKRSCLG
jgi:hypothetical protein